MMRIPVRVAAIVAISLSIPGQSGAQSCTPPGCIPTFPAPQPSATPVVRAVCRDRENLILLVTLFNPETVKVSSVPKISDVALFANGRIFHPTFTSRDPEHMIAPGGFVDRVSYHADLPAGVNGVATLNVGPEPTITFDLDSLNFCPW
jgi:hypothetical protein